MTDHEELVKKYSTPRKNLDPDVRAWVEAADAELDELKKQGNHASPEMAARHNVPIGLDDNLQPFPVNNPDEKQDTP